MSGNKLLVILCDGFKWNYFDIKGVQLPWLHRLISGGTKSEYLEPVFPSLSFPNYYSLMTGLYCEDHGMVGNFMYDEYKEEKFSNMVNAESEHSHWWEYAEPFWVTAEKQGKRTGMFEWPGGQVTHKGIKPTHIVPVNKETWSTISDFSRYSLDVVKKFKQDLIDMAGIYIGETDTKGHELEANSVEFCQTLKDLDAAIGTLMTTLEAEDITDKVNIVIFSDHGMADISQSRSIDMSDVLKSPSIKVYTDCGHMCNIWPHQGREEEVYSALNNLQLEHITVYRKEEIPIEWRYKNHKLVPPIVAVADNGWFILTPEHPSVYCKRWHGYTPDSEDMRGIFLAKGPDVKRNNGIGALSAVDVYQVLCRLLGITPLKHGGDWSKVQSIFK